MGKWRDVSEDTTKGLRTQQNKRTSEGNNIENKQKGAWRMRTTTETTDDSDEDNKGPSPENNRDDKENQGEDLVMLLRP